MIVSIIIPVWQDNHALARLLADLQQAGCAANEIIVVDGNVDPDCRILCQKYQARWIPSKACRGLQLDTGACAASGDVLWFVHADTVIHANALSEISACMVTDAVGGYFRFCLDGLDNWCSRFFAMVTNWRTRIGIPYGDQGLFMSAAAYRQSGGFPHQPLFEEVRLVKRLRQLGKFTMLPQFLATSPRRWQRDGWWRRTLINRGLALAYRFGVPAGCLHSWYIRHQRFQNPSDQTATLKASQGS